MILPEMTLEEARKIGEACATTLYPPTNPVVLARAIPVLLLTHEPADRTNAAITASWLVAMLADA